MTRPAQQPADVDGPFHGAKAALVLGTRLVVLRRDAIPGIAWPGAIDLPGGGREGGETPMACVLREIAEETGLVLPPARLTHARPHATAEGPAWFFAGRITAAEAARLRLGDEGSAVWLMETRAFAASGEAVPHLRALVAAAVARVLGHAL